jgi:hypothetical protein
MPGPSRPLPAEYAERRWRPPRSPLHSRASLKAWRHTNIIVHYFD